MSENLEKPLSMESRRFIEKLAAILKNKSSVLNEELFCPKEEVGEKTIFGEIKNPVTKRLFSFVNELREEERHLDCPKGENDDAFKAFREKQKMFSEQEELALGIFIQYVQSEIPKTVFCKRFAINRGWVVTEAEGLPMSAGDMLKRVVHELTEARARLDRIKFSK